MLKRLFWDSLFFISIIIAPFWVSVVFGVILFFFLRNFFELAAGLFIIDLLYGLPLERFSGNNFVGLFAGIIIVALLFFSEEENTLA